MSGYQVETQVQVVEVLVAGPIGPPGPKGDTGDLTPEAEQLLADAQAAAASAANSATTALSHADDAAASAGTAGSAAVSAGASASAATAAASEADDKAGEAAASAAAAAALAAGVAQAIEDHVEAVDPHGDRSFATSAIAAAVAAHVAELNPHSQYLLAAQLASTAFLSSGTSAARSLEERFADAVNVKDTGAVGDGTTDDTPAFLAAITAAGPYGCVEVPKPAARYRITGTLTPLDGQIIRTIGGKHELFLDSATEGTLFDLSGKQLVKICRFTLDGNSANTPSEVFINMASSVGCELVELIGRDMPSSSLGSIIIRGTSTDCKVLGCSFEDTEGIAVSISGESNGNRPTNNTVKGNTFSGGGSFGIRLARTDENKIIGNRTKSNAIELIGLTRTAHSNLVAWNHAEGCGDNGISISGKNNRVIGNTAVGNNYAGIYAWGSQNTIVGNFCKNNNQALTTWPGIGTNANFGGCGQFNTITGNTCDDDQATPTQFSSIAFQGENYTDWASAQSITAGNYRVQGLNVYEAATDGATGVTAPVHTSGTVSDGGVDWTYVDTFITAATSIFNQAIGNTLGRHAAGGSDVIDSDTLARNTVAGYTGWHLSGPATLFQTDPRFCLRDSDTTGVDSATGGLLFQDAAASTVAAMGPIGAGTVRYDANQSSGAHQFRTGSTPSEQVRITNTNTAVNRVQMTGATTTNPPVVQAAGETNVSLQLTAGGTGTVLVGNRGTASASAGAATVNGQRGAVTTEALTTAAGADYVLTLTNSKVSASSVVVASVDNGTNTTEGVAVNRVTPGNGSVTIRVRNTHASSALNGTLKINFAVF